LDNTTFQTMCQDEDATIYTGISEEIVEGSGGRIKKTSRRSGMSLKNNMQNDLLERTSVGPSTELTI